MHGCIAHGLDVLLGRVILVEWCACMQVETEERTSGANRELSSWICHIITRAIINYSGNNNDKGRH